VDSLSCFSSYFLFFEPYVDAAPDLRQSTNASQTFAFVSVDMGMGSAAVTERVLALLDAEPTTTGVFTNENICLSGTHTHSAPAGEFTSRFFVVVDF
jgi:hypothetical protein